MKKEFIIRIAAISGMLAVIFGAFGAHGLKNLVESSAILTWETAARYQFYHAFALLLIALLMFHMEGKLLRVAALMFIFGIFFFSGSLYLLALRAVIPFELTWLGPITPIGGLFFILGWLFLFLSAGKNVPSKI